MLLAVSAATALLYQSGLSGPFLFDDHVHITQNRWVHIDSLDWADLAQAACNPIDDKRGTVGFRTHVAGVLARRVARIAYDRARENQ